MPDQASDPFGHPVDGWTRAVLDILLDRLRAEGYTAHPIYEFSDIMVMSPYGSVYVLLGDDIVIVDTLSLLSDRVLLCDPDFLDQLVVAVAASVGRLKIGDPRALLDSP